MGINDLKNEIPFIAKSLSGHDKEKTYVAIGFDGDRVLLADGKARPLCRPKKKNLAHIQAEFHTQAVLQLRELIDIKDSDIIHLLKGRKGE